jgi:GTP-binding protein
LPEVAVVGRSNVGKSSLINALVRQRVARTSATPGKTRLANIYRVEKGASAPFYLVDLPGYGYARRSSATETREEASRGFEALTEAYFARGKSAVVLLVDSRHPGLANDLEAWAWLKERAAAGEIVATKIVATKVDKLSHGERIRAMRELESVLEHSVLPVSVVTGEGLDELWNQIDRLANSNREPRTPKAMALPPPTRPQPPHPRPPLKKAERRLPTKAESERPKKPRKR